MKEMRDLPLFKAWREEGHKEGLAEGLEKALERELALLRKLLLKTVKARMPEWSELAQEQAALIDSPEVLSDLTFKLATAKTSKQAERYLRNWNKPTMKKNVE